MKGARVWFLFTAITSLTLALACGVLGNPNPCDRAQGMRDALEESSGRDCDLITEDDLAEVYKLRIYGADELEKSDFSSLVNIHWLDLRRGEGDLPWNVISGLSNVRDLDLSRNNLRELPPNAFAGLENLQTLSLGQNNLHELPNGLFAGLENLQTLSLGQNNLRELPNGLFDGLSNLRELHLGGNPGDPFDVEIGVCGQVPAVRRVLEREASLNCAGITDASLSDVHSLTVHDDNLTGLQPGVFDDMANLQTLELTGRSLSELSPGAFNGLGNLRILTLGVGDLRELEPGVFAGLDNLEELTLWGANLPEPKPGMFAMLVNLQTLSLQSRNLTELPPGVFNDLKNLQVLDLRSNPGRPFHITHPNANLRGRGWDR